VFSEILKIVPKLDEKDLKSMQGALQGRFTKIAKGFGKGLKGALMGGGIAGIAIGLIDKLLNPLKEVQEAIDRTLSSSDDLATNAAQFNTSAGKLFKLVTLAKATGLDQDSLFTLLTKFQTAVAEAKANPNDPANSAVKNYVNTEDISEAFFGFITQLQKMDKNSQVLIQKQVFGEKQILKMADFLQQDFGKLAKLTGIDRVSSKGVGGSIEKLGALSDLKGALQAKREFNDIQAKAKAIDGNMVRNMDKSAQIELDRENQKIKSYNDLAALSQTTASILFKVEEGVAALGKFVAYITPTMEKGIRLFEQMLKAPIFRGVKGLFGGGKDD
jgi:uncharacterized protein YidB (DUF937 family)